MTVAHYAKRPNLRYDDRGLGALFSQHQDEVASPPAPSPLR